ncbi:hemolysin III family protein [Entomospira entomophila]|uniref:Hemolysin III family protein n=1 Tax=Entomospira entomophila TaxID=2719988 RepID=A0A968G984_9SPIO|nr:hemolysin III family protein [Entomospira entomophilus]NIZ40326.1 hemolysin III family protein [Entomospira entomophilus]WDI35885.1 hemolysin III family protein [Entomospira entomophilus]
MKGSPSSDLPQNEPWSALSHLVGAGLSVVALVLLVTQSVRHATPTHTIGFLIYGVSQLLLYTMSTLYHSFKRETRVKQVFRRFDHISIFWFIAGTYTPISLVVLPAPMDLILIVIIWSIALLGTLFKAVWVRSPGWMNSTLYVIMGWIAIYAIIPLYHGVGLIALLLMILGGMLYSVGAVIYALGKKRDLKTSMRMHDIFHLFVLAGSIAFFAVMYLFILPMPLTA